MNLHLASTTPGKTWALSASKDHRGNIIGFAVEGDRSDDGRSFEFVVFGSRQVRVSTGATRATRKALADALAAVQTKLIDDGLVNVAP